MSRRGPEVEQQIADAREEPTSAELQADAELQAERRAAQIAEAEAERVWNHGFVPPDPAVWNPDGSRRNEPPHDSLTLTGAELVAYRQLQAVAKQAQAAQSAMVATGAALREAIQGLCAVMAPGAK